jgi:hypothetical protein
MVLHGLALQEKTIFTPVTTLGLTYPAVAPSLTYYHDTGFVSIGGPDGSANSPNLLQVGGYTGASTLKLFGVLNQATTHFASIE